jgi:hypothetical protein
MLTIMLLAWQEACDRRWSSFVIFPGLTEQRRNRPPTARHDVPWRLAKRLGWTRPLHRSSDRWNQLRWRSESQSGMHLGRSSLPLTA